MTVEQASPTQRCPWYRVWWTPSRARAPTGRLDRATAPKATGAQRMKPTSLGPGSMLNGQRCGCAASLAGECADPADVAGGAAPAVRSELRWEGLACPAHDDSVEPGHSWLFGYEVADVGDEGYDLAVVADGWSGADVVGSGCGGDGDGDAGGFGGVGLDLDLLVERRRDRRSAVWPCASAVLTLTK